MPTAGFEPAIPAIKRLQTYVLDRTATHQLFRTNNLTATSDP
jgi:hypothetical protein